uniref:Carotenoid cleavage dioxygenase 4 n=1 Tax=Cajanus cajan TaxID=3821 RepID=A0A151QVB4_CAJCA|nr:hypothetical protein KK1_044934 [Cajanus cajan]
MLNAFDDIINNFIDPPLKPSVDPRRVLTQNFAPVHELPPTPCEVVQGSLPPCLDGAYIRNGPNPQFLPRGPYHLFDGDGMLHALRISQGKPTLCSRYVKTYKYKVENDAGFPLFPNVFSGFGRYDFEGKLAFSMTAHPKIDPDTGECFAFRYGPVPPFLTYFRFDPNGRKHPDVPIFSVLSPSFLHDFAITKNYAIFCDIQLGMNPIDMLLYGGSPLGSVPSKVPRIGILPRDAKDESMIKWLEVPGFNIMHAINAWDEDDGRTVVLVAPNILSLEHAMERMELVHAVVEKVRINLETGIVTRQPLSARNLDFAVINPAYVGKKNRFVYAAVGDPMPKISGVVKLDVSEEAVEEDDGYLVSYVHDERSGESKFVVMDAKSPELEVVAAVRLPRRVPYGFHGLFVKESELRKVSLSLS